MAVTASGLKKLGLPGPELAQFSNEFTTGMTTPHRRRMLGDLGSNAPEAWLWGGPQTPQVDLLLLQFARDEASLDQSTRQADGSSDPRRRTWLAAKMVGRWPSGAPVTLSPDEDDPSLATANDFTYFYADEFGLSCPNVKANLSIGKIELHNIVAPCELLNLTLSQVGLDSLSVPTVAIA